MMIRLDVKLALLFALLLPLPAVCGTELVLRERATITGPMIRLGDVADISSQTSSELKDLVTTSLIPAPAPGTQRFLQRSQIVDLLVSRGVETENLRIRGAKVVEISTQVSAINGGSKLQSTAAAALSKQVMTAGETQAAVETAIEQQLIKQSGHGQWQVVVEVKRKELSEIAGWGSNFTVSGAKHPRTGRQRFRIIDPNTKDAISVMVEVSQIHSLVYARHLIARGSLVRASDVEIRQYEGTAPILALIDLRQTIGMEARRAISPNSVLTENHVRAPMLVKRGETVSVFASTGGITVRTTAVAKQDGAKGELVQVESLDGKKRFAASVSGYQRLDVYPIGVHVDDFTSLRPKQTVQR